MHFLYWSPVVPQLLPLVSQEIKRNSGSSHLTVQLHADEKTIHYNEARVDEMVRCDALDLLSMKRWINGFQNQKKNLIIDVWGVLGRSSFDTFCEDLSKLLPYFERSIVIMPRVWSSAYRLHPFYKDADANTKEVFDALFARSRAIFEAIWNSRSETFVVATPPPFALLESLAGRQELAANKFLGLNFLPAECRKFEGEFISSHKLFAEVVSKISITLGNWSQTAMSDIGYIKGVRKQLDPTKPLVASGENPGMTLSMSWKRYLQGRRLAENLPANELARGEFSAEKVARWYYFLAVLENVAPQLEHNVGQISTHLFGQNTSHAT